MPGVRTEASFQRGIGIRRLPREVFAFVADPRNEPRWRRRVRRCEQLPVGDLPARYVARQRPLLTTRTGTAAVTVVEIDAPRAVTIERVCDEGEWRLVFQVAAAELQARLTVHVTVAWRMPRAFVPLARRAAEVDLDSDLRTLRAVLERAERDGRTTPAP